MTGVGASDAFFCDAYADLISRTLRAKASQPDGQIQDKLNNLKVPVVTVLDCSNSWRWRMAAREMIEKENVLSIQRIKDLLNIFCRDRHKLLTRETVEKWILHADTMQRHFGISRHGYQQTPTPDKATAKKNALEKFGRRMQSVFQRRHDCIHNCDRPKLAIKAISANATQKALEDVSFLVNRCIEHMRGNILIIWRNVASAGRLETLLVPPEDGSRLVQDQARPGTLSNARVASRLRSSRFGG